MEHRNTNLMHRDCPVCNSNTSTTEFCKNNFSYVRCHSCGLMYINPIPDIKALSQDYDALGDKYFTDPRKIETDFAIGRFDRELGFLEAAGCTGSLLDVGCATGSFIEAAKNNGYESPTGIDISTPSILFAKNRGLNAVKGNFAEGVFSENTFDVITMLATLEHVPFPGEFVAEAARVLKPNGKLIVTVPNTQSMTDRILGKKGRYYSIHHLNYFSSSNLSELFQSNGFKIHHVETRGINPYKIWEDIRGIPLDVDRQIAGNQQATKIKTKGKASVSMMAFKVLDSVLNKSGHGDLLLIAGQLNPCP